MATSSGRFSTNTANLARCDPRDFKFAIPKGSSFKSSYLMYKEINAPVLCYAFGNSVADRTKTPQQFGSGSYAKQFSIVPQALEMERKVAFLCQVAGVKEYSANIWGNVLTFATRAGPWSFKGERPSPPTSMFPNIL